MLSTTATLTTTATTAMPVQADSVSTLGALPTLGELFAQAQAQALVPCQQQANSGELTSLSLGDLFFEAESLTALVAEVDGPANWVRV